MTSAQDEYDKIKHESRPQKRKWWKFILFCLLLALASANAEADSSGSGSEYQVPWTKMCRNCQVYLGYPELGCYPVYGQTSTRESLANNLITDSSGSAFGAYWRDCTNSTIPSRVAYGGMTTRSNTEMADFIVDSGGYYCSCSPGNNFSSVYNGNTAILNFTSPQVVQSSRISRPTDLTCDLVVPSCSGNSPTKELEMTMSLLGYTEESFILFWTSCVWDSPRYDFMREGCRYNYTECILSYAVNFSPCKGSHAYNPYSGIWIDYSVPGSVVTTVTTSPTTSSIMATTTIFHWGTETLTTASTASQTLVPSTSSHSSSSTSRTTRGPGWITITTLSATTSHSVATSSSSESEGPNTTTSSFSLSTATSSATPGEEAECGDGNFLAQIFSGAGCFFSFFISGVVSTVISTALIVCIILLMKRACPNTIFKSKFFGAVSAAKLIVIESRPRTDVVLPPFRDLAHIVEVDDDGMELEDLTSREIMRQDEVWAEYSFNTHQ